MTFRIFATNAFNAVLQARLPEFERARGITSEIEFTSSNRIQDRMVAGEHFDLVLAAGSSIDRLIEHGKVLAGSRADLGAAGVGLCVRKGAPKPDISTVDAFRKALLDAKSVAYTQTGQSGIYFASLLDRLGLMAAIKPKAIVHPGGLIGHVIARGDAELGAQQVSEILAVPEVDLVGPLPAEIQNATMFSAGIGAATQQADTARALIAFLKTEDVKRVMRETGLEPV